MVAPLVAALVKAHTTTAVKAKATVKVAKFKAAAAAIKAKAQIASFRYLHRCYHAYSRYINHYHRRLHYLNRRFAGRYRNHKYICYKRALNGFRLRSHWLRVGYHKANHGRVVSAKWYYYNRAHYYAAHRYARYYAHWYHIFIKRRNYRAARICRARYYNGIRHMRYRHAWMRVWAKRYHVYARYQRAIRHQWYRNRNYWRRFYAYYSRRTVTYRWAQ